MGKASFYLQAITKLWRHEVMKKKKRPNGREGAAVGAEKRRTETARRDGSSRSAAMVVFRSLTVAGALAGVKAAAHAAHASAQAHTEHRVR